MKIITLNKLFLVASITVAFNLFSSNTAAFQELLRSYRSLDHTEQAHIKKTVIDIEKTIKEFLKDAVDFFHKAEQLKEQIETLNDADTLQNAISLAATVRPIVQAINKLLKEIEGMGTRLMPLSGEARQVLSSMLEKLIPTLTPQQMRSAPQTQIMTVVNHICSTLDTLMKQL